MRRRVQVDVRRVVSAYGSGTVTVTVASRRASTLSRPLPLPPASHYQSPSGVTLRSSLTSIPGAIPGAGATTGLHSYRCAALHTSAHLSAPDSSPSLAAASAKYDPIYRASIEDPSRFWAGESRRLRWSQPPDATSALSRVGEQPWDYRWYAGAKLNACDNMLDRHVDEGRGERTAIIYDSPVTDTVKHISYQRLLDEVSRLAGALRHAGVQKGDRVLIYMPMTPQTIAAALATTRLGGVHVIVFGGFAAAELAKRIKDAEPRVILTASCGLESKTKVIAYKPALDEAIALSGHKPEKVLVLQRPQCKAQLQPGERDADWEEYVAKHGKPTGCVQVDATDPMYILHTSGTTGTPKGVVRDVGSLVSMHAVMEWLYGHDRDKVFWSASDLGWAVGHTCILYGPLVQGTTTVMYEGKPVGTPDAGAFGRVIAQHRVAALVTAPTALRAILREDNEGKLMKQHDLSSFEALYLAGERTDPTSLHWAERVLAPAPIIDHWWQTETGWGVCGNPRGIALHPTKAGSTSKPLPGWDVRVLDDEGKELKAGQIGNIVLKLPVPPAGLHTLWRNPERFVKGYMQRFPGFYDSADAGMIDEEGYVFVMSRTDDVLNVAGHRLSSGQMEEVLQLHPSVAESAVIGIPDEFRGQVPLGLIVLKTGNTESHESIESAIVASVRQHVGAIANLKRVIVVQRLPKTRSGKVLRGLLRTLAEGNRPATVPATIEDASVIEEVKQTLRQAGIGTTGNNKQQ